jgi:hypothetical protein
MLTVYTITEAVSLAHSHTTDQFSFTLTRAYRMRSRLLGFARQKRQA